MRGKIDEPRLLELLRHARRPEPIEEALEGMSPIKDLVHRLGVNVIPLIEQQRDRNQRQAMLDELEEELRDVFKVLDAVESAVKETRRTCSGLRAVGRKLRPKRPSQPPASEKGGRTRTFPKYPTNEHKAAVLDALRRSRSQSMGELCHGTGFGMSRLGRVLAALREEGKVKKTGTTSATRYHLTAKGRRS